MHGWKNIYRLKLLLLERSCSFQRLDGRIPELNSLAPQASANPSNRIAWRAHYKALTLPSTPLQFHADHNSATCFGPNAAFIGPRGGRCDFYRGCALQSHHIHENSTLRVLLPATTTSVLISILWATKSSLALVNNDSTVLAPLRCTVL